MNYLKISILLAFLTTVSYAQKMQSIPLIGSECPSFKASTTNGTIYFPKDYGDNWKLVLSHPLDFTPVCSSELLELSSMQEDFKNLNVELLVVSTDNLSRHNDWIKALESIKDKEGNPVKIFFPLVDDHNKEISLKFGMLHQPTSTTKDVRGVFIIDPNNVIRSVQFYPMEIGRNMDEIKRSIIALQTAEKYKVYTPANWKPGEDVLVPYENDVSQQETENYTKKSWMLIYKSL